MKIVDWAKGLFKKDEAQTGAPIGKEVADQWHKLVKNRTGVERTDYRIEKEVYVKYFSEKDESKVEAFVLAAKSLVQNNPEEKVDPRLVAAVKIVSDDQFHKPAIQHESLCRELRYEFDNITSPKKTNFRKWRRDYTAA